ncbi:NAC domain-containing protein 12-like [Hibiscus syriacus]|uniref:NAC domain-containing protein 12-like n=1 Tax=Hibiscus syriacus TaxID=106335 RepID=A0A6A3C7V8_HIBSY|nr:NAC domain-containing protein 12-like [Hibiscus syriacus]
MGNCLFGGFEEEVADGLIEVITSNGGIMEFSAPISAGNIVDGFCGNAIFRSNDLLCKPICHHEELLPGKSYYLLPLNSKGNSPSDGDNNIVREGHVRSKSDNVPSSVISPYRLSCDVQGSLKRSYTDILSRYNNDGRGFWKVKLVIGTEQLLDILSQEARTQELMENVRTVAKCGNGASKTVGLSDQWSRSSSRKNSSTRDGLFLENVINN